MNIAKSIIDDLRQYIDGVPFPASRKEIITFARNKGADNAVINVLDKLPAYTERKIYKSQLEVLQDVNQK